MFNKIIEKTNFYLAWLKLKKTYNVRESWFDEFQLAKFEANIEEEISKIIYEIENDTYKLNKIRPIAHPKVKNEKGPRVRQYFWVAPRDQLTWLAVSNILGPHLDAKMPFWSFGNRLFRSVWFEKSPDKEYEDIKIGWYRNSSGNIYRKWAQSWPRFRKCVSITAKVMLNNNIFKNDANNFEKIILDEYESNDFRQRNNVGEYDIKYWNTDYWNKSLKGELYWASIDFEKFYPKINNKKIFENIHKYIPKNKINKKLSKLLYNLLNFEINCKGWESDELEQIDLKWNFENFNAIPTGLMAGGFLANVALLEVDEKIEGKLEIFKNVAHFRFVDDHIILCDDIKDLIKWIREYERILESSNTGAKISLDKIEPNILKEALTTNRKIEYREIKKACKLDSVNPIPLTTQTLAKISQINQLEIELLDDDQEKNLKNDLFFLLLADMPEQEIRKDTRISYAVSYLTRLHKSVSFDNIDLYNKIAKLKEIEKRIINFIELENGNNTQKKYKELINEKEQANIDIEKKVIDIRGEGINYGDKKLFAILLKAVSENHQKIRLWAKLLDFCKSVGYNGLTDVIKEISVLQKNNEITELTVEFLIALILQILSDYVLYSVIKLFEPTTEELDKIAFKKFLENILCDSFMQLISKYENNKNKFYLKRSFKLFRFSLGCAVYYIEILRPKDDIENFYLDGNKIYKQYKIFNWNDIEKQRNDISIMTWWVVNKTIPKKRSIPNIFWNRYINYTDGNNKLDSKLFALFPRYLLPNKIRLIYNNKNLEKLLENKGWLYEVEYRNFKDQQTYLNKQYSNLYNWTDNLQEKLKKITNFDNFFDPKFSEWTSLAIVQQICQKITKELKINPFYFYDNVKNEYLNVHPSNYLIPSEWFKSNNMSWENWRKIVNENQVKFVNKEEFIRDNRFTPDFLNLENSELSIVIGLGKLLVCLLRLDFDLPYVWNKIGLQETNISIGKNLVSNYPISSYTFSIISSVLNLRNIDTIYVKSYQNDIIRFTDVWDDSVIDMPPIYTIEELTKRLNTSINILERYQISVHNNLPRQLIPISLSQLSYYNNPFFKEELENI
ncbi:MAG: RNA-directed DNA polymerase [Ignavibacteriae bacterium]|nr:MAG: RNA-directed DNA polymerase [Ignavibacteriota bacterium]